jgi:hypothetical protein
MKNLPSSVWLFALCASAVFAASCSSTPGVAPAGPVQNTFGKSILHAAPAPVLLTVNRTSGVLESWPIKRGGGVNPQKVSKRLGTGSPSGMAANGNVVFIANSSPPEVIQYDTVTKAKTTLPDPYGIPIDIAIDKNASLYVVNAANPVGNVTMYPAGSPQPMKLDCRFINLGEAIAVDNEGDIFVNGYGPAPAYVTGVVEIPNGPSGPQPQNCVRLQLKREPGYVAGLAVDPKTDDLLVLDDPDLCAGGVEGRLTIYPKPYQKDTGTSHDLGGICAGGIRLDATSSTLFMADQDVSGSFPFIRQRGYPDLGDMGTYNGGGMSGFTTIPNTLPN